MNRKTGKISLVCSCTYCLFLFAGVIIFFGYAISSAAEVTLAWDANTETDLMGYKIHYDTSPGNPYYGMDADQGISPVIVFLNDLDDLHNPKFTLTGLGDSGDYYFALTAFDNENLESGFSNEASTAEGNSGGGSRGRGVELMVHDYGVGITVDNQSRIFEGFFTTQETMDYSSKQPYDFNAGGKGADLLRMKIFSERHNFKIDMTSSRCPHIPLDKDICPGKISKCAFCKKNEDCHRSGGTTFSVYFPVSSDEGRVTEEKS